MNPFNIALPTFLACLLIAYVLRETALGKLDALQTGTVVLTLRPLRIRCGIACASLLALFLVARFILPQLLNWRFVGVTCFLLLFAVLVVTQIAAAKSLMRLQLPRAFHRFYGVSMIFDVLSWLALIGGMIAATLGYGHHR